MTTDRHTKTRRPIRGALLTLQIGALVLIGVQATGCSDSPKRRAKAVLPDVSTLRDVPQALRNTVGSYVSVRGDRPLMVSGYGIVVGLDGTGSADVPPALRNRLEREMGLRGVGQETFGMGWISPTEMLNDPNTAVVVVRAVLPPGSVEGQRFDALVTIAPGTSTTSLEGGRLWTTDLYKGQISPSGPVTESLAQVSGPIFINPFSDPAGEVAGFGSLTGRVLGGGAVTTPLDLVLVLDVASYARASAITSAINAKFPRARGDRESAARGVSEDVIELNVPRRYAGDPAEFLNLVMHTRVDSMIPQIAAGLYTRALLDHPELANDLSWCLQALGRSALPSLRELYDHPDAGPRLAALQAGARLQDALTAPQLRDLAETGPPAIRGDAIDMLARLDADPRINNFLRELLDAPDSDIRVAAYQALIDRGDRRIERRNIDGKFLVDTIPSDSPMIYIAQQGEPRVVLFGEGLSLPTPTFVSGWSNRLMLNADQRSDEVGVYYLDYKTDVSTTASVSTQLNDLVRFFAHEQTPDHPAPGLGMTYSETVGALYVLASNDALPAPLIAEQDVLAAELIHSLEGADVRDRPETDTDDPEAIAAQEAPDPALLPSVTQFDQPQTGDPRAPAKRTFVVPIPPKSGR
ncbi:MAG: flagellar basal body P-ring protein FlgI [Phycisphaeraceae bacterium]|nr:flagellar basal body P-ring protein FlgI [Phycisphaeraceae bacterium]